MVLVIFLICAAIGFLLAEKFQAPSFPSALSRKCFAFLFQLSPIPGLLDLSEREVSFFPPQIGFLYAFWLCSTRVDAIATFFFSAPYPLSFSFPSTTFSRLVLFWNTVFAISARPHEQVFFLVSCKHPRTDV